MVAKGTGKGRGRPKGSTKANASPASAGDESGKTNQFNATTVKRFFGEIEKCYSELETLQAEYMNACRGVRQSIKQWRDQAAEAGLPRKAMALELKRRGYEKRIKKLIANAEAEDAELADLLREKLGDYKSTPLGEAAIEAVEKRAATKSAAIDSLVGDGSLVNDTPDEKDIRPRHVQEAEATRIAENKSRLEAGMKQLDGDGH